MAGRIFISYSKRNPQPTRELAAFLEGAGFDVWWDTNLTSGERFDEAIRRELDAADAVIVIWTPESVGSTWVKSEADYADRRRKLITLSADNVDLDTLPLPYNTYHCDPITNRPAIRAAIARILGGHAPAQPARQGGFSSAADDRLFAEVDRLGTDQDYRFYLEEFPQGAHAAVARLRLRRLDEAAAAAEAQARERRWRQEGRVPVDVGPKDGRETRWLLPGGGRDPAEVFRDLPNGPEMVVVPAGDFMMGSPEDEPERELWKKGVESPRHRVEIAKPFAVGRRAVTRGQFAAFVAATGHRTEGGAEVWTGSEWKKDPNASWRAPGFAQDDSHPVVCVSCADAEAYAAWLAGESGLPYRLLSEAEWEYVARAGTDTPFWWGKSITPSQANYDGNFVYAGGGGKGEYRKGTVAANSFQANPWGLYSVHGNTFEWCADCWNDSYQGAPIDGSAWKSGDCSRAVLRGGAWSINPWYLRSANRNWGTRDFRFNNVGFRVSRTLAD